MVVKKRLDDGFDISGGLQQPAHSSSEEEARMAELEERKWRHELYDIVKDIAMALTGEEWTIKQKG